MPKRKTNPDQKSKQGFDSSVTDSMHNHEGGSHDANKLQQEQLKKEKSSKNQGEWNGMHE
ncbi:hypothetical protein LRR81_14450 [Metabacillus sp. GX 13764]|uniref:hypothetical protein n=1 Tax=Metabacillus kandeliae TaxID=2900151 RepID=UPI001E36D13D|nr:hypothetical protein [Metabacillus kandeliae]MCD7035443.1 hypothetical protein [Metabacillus kandeliae]